MRTFIAFEVPDALRRELARLSASLQTALAGVPLRWVPPRNMHLTLKFLGETQPQQVATLGDALQAIASQYSPLQVSLGKLGTFPNSKQPRVIWVGLHAPAALAKLLSKLSRQR